MMPYMYSNNARTVLTFVFFEVLDVERLDRLDLKCLWQYLNVAGCVVCTGDLWSQVDSRSSLITVITQRVGG